MVLLVVYKSKCKSQADESLEAAITAVVAEEEELEAALSQGKFDYAIHGPRQSLGNMSAPAYTRFLSVGGTNFLLDIPTRKKPIPSLTPDNLSIYRIRKSNESTNTAIRKR